MVDTQEPSGWFLLRPASGFQMAAFSRCPSVVFRPCLHMPWCVPISSHKDISQMRLGITLQTVLACDFICSFMLGCAPSSCCARAVSSCRELGPSSLWCVGFPGQRLLLRSSAFSSWSSRAPELRSCGSGASVAPPHVGSSRPRDQTHVSCTGRKILHHWATGEAQRHSDALF